MSTTPLLKGPKKDSSTAVRIIPYLVAILVGIGVFRASGAMDYLIDGIDRRRKAMRYRQ